MALLVASGSHYSVEMASPEDRIHFALSLATSHVLYELGIYMRALKLDRDHQRYIFETALKSSPMYQENPSLFVESLNFYEKFHQTYSDVESTLYQAQLRNARSRHVGPLFSHWWKNNRFREFVLDATGFNKLGFAFTTSGVAGSMYQRLIKELEREARSAAPESTNRLRMLKDWTTTLPLSRVELQVSFGQAITNVASPEWILEYLRADLPRQQHATCKRLFQTYPEPQRLF